jgi:hypothetical protein
MDKEVIHKELDLIQDVIKRMASNSFEVKKWLIGILTAIVVFKHEELLGGNGRIIWVLLVPIICFWYLDAFFLRTEKLYRVMYHWVIRNRPRTSKYLYDLNTMVREFPEGTVENFIQEKNSVWRVAFSKTLWPFYAVPVFFIVVYAVIQYCSGE